MLIMNVKVDIFRYAEYEFVGCELFSSSAVNDNWHQTPALSLLFFDKKNNKNQRLLGWSKPSNE